MSDLLSFGNGHSRGVSMHIIKLLIPLMLWSFLYIGDKIGAKKGAADSALTSLIARPSHSSGGKTIFHFYAYSCVT